MRIGSLIQMKPKPKIEGPATRPKQEVPAEIIEDLMRVIRQQFCPEMSDKDWFKNEYRFIKQKVVTWPAYWITEKKHFTVTSKRYQEIMLGIIKGIKKHGNTGKVLKWHAYLTYCVQSHWEKHWEEYYQESKSLNNLADLSVLGLSKLPIRDSDPEIIRGIAMAHRVLAGPKKRPQKKQAEQTELF